jgi:N-acetylneuraminate synthase
MSSLKECDFSIAGRPIGDGHPTYVIAEMSANHNQDLGEALDLVNAAAEAGVDAIKLQTYTPDTITLDCDNEYFRIKGTMWEGRNLHQLYSEAFTPWEWHPSIMKAAADRGLHCFSSPFDASAVDFLESLEVPAYKIASFETVDLPLIRRVARTGKPMIMSTGMASLAEIEEAVRTFRDAGGQQLALLKCTSAYPAPATEMNLRTIPHLAQAFAVPTGLSDHTLGATIPLVAITLGARIVEKHLARSRNTPGPDSAFSMEPAEFRDMVEAIRNAEQALGYIRYGYTDREAPSRAFRRSLFVVRDVVAGEVFTTENVRSIRPGHGIHTRYLEDVLGRVATRDITRGTPLAWELISP